MARKKETRRMMKRTEFRFVIDAYSPATFPMARLGQYLTHLASLFGEEKSVHFRELVEGSTVPVVDVEYEAVPKVRTRLESAKSDQAGEAGQVMRSINRMLREDNATAKLLEKRVRKPVLSFMGRLEQMERPLVTHRSGSIDGKLVRIGGTDQTIHAILLSEGRTFAHIDMTETVAKRLAPRLLEFVRLEGKGRWERDEEGHWELKHFRVERVEPLADVPLSQALKELREVGLEWDDETALDELKRLRRESDPDEGD